MAYLEADDDEVSLN